MVSKQPHKLLWWIMTEFQRFSNKQKQVFRWWIHKGRQYEGIICDGAIRSGKTTCMGLSFVLWSMVCFSHQNFAFCGKTILSLRRNLIRELVEQLRATGFLIKEHYTQNLIEISHGKTTNYYYLFGGNDESAASRVQGVTLAGVLFDEVALMPESFVNQTLARCSVKNSKFWFNCNPEHPYHWFYLEWIQRAKSKNLYYLHFTMDDNPSLSKIIKQRYQSLYTGNFYNRFVLGQWVETQGAIYSLFNRSEHCFKGEIVNCEKYYIACDYGIQNPFSLGLYALKGKNIYRVKEYYYDGRKEAVTRTDLDYYRELRSLAGSKTIEAVIVDPSASSFISLIEQQKEFKVIKAKNNVLQGISQVTQLLKEKRLFIEESCEHCLKEFHLYRWDFKKQGDNPKKENDHTMDELRYFVSTIVFEDSQKQENFFVLSAPR